MDALEKYVIISPKRTELFLTTWSMTNMIGSLPKDVYKTLITKFIWNPMIKWLQKPNLYNAADKIQLLTTSSWVTITMIISGLCAEVGMTDKIRTYWSGELLAKSPTLDIDLSVRDDILLVNVAKKWERHKILTDISRKVLNSVRDSNTNNINCTIVEECINAFINGVLCPKTSSSKNSTISLHPNIIRLVDTALKNIEIMRDNDILDQNEAHIKREYVSLFMELMFVYGSMSGNGTYNTLDHILRRIKYDVSHIPIHYQSYIEGKYEEEVKDFYTTHAKKFYESLSSIYYIRKVSHILDAERFYIRTFMHHSTLKRVEEMLTQLLISEYATALINKEGSSTEDLLSSEKYADLSTIFNVFSMVDISLALKPMASAYGKFIIAQGTKINERICSDSEYLTDPSEEEQYKYVEDIVKLLDKFTKITKNTFKNHYLFQEQLKDSISHIINTPLKKAPFTQVLADYINFMFKNKKIDSTIREQSIKDAVGLSIYIFSLDEFIIAYEFHLANRLLNNSTNKIDDMENVSISIMKLLLTTSLTKMESMLRDLQQSYLLNERYSAILSTDKDKVEYSTFSPTLLCNSHWPRGTEVIPPEVSDEFNVPARAFEEFYRREGNDLRIIEWLWSAGRAEIYTYSAGRKYILTMSCLQAMVALKFNERKKWSLSDICAATKVKDNIMKRVLDPLLPRQTPKGLVNGIILRKANADKSVINYYFNEKYLNKLMRIDIPQPKYDTTKAQANTLQEERKFVLDSVIVRVMKTRSKLSITDLMAEVLHQIRTFVPQPRDIKLRIEDLIAREYLERDPENPGMFTYLA